MITNNLSSNICQKLLQSFTTFASCKKNILSLHRIIHSMSNAQASRTLKSLNHFTLFWCQNFNIGGLGSTAFPLTPQHKPNFSMTETLVLEKYIKELFIEEKERGDKFLTEDDLIEILDEKFATNDEIRTSIIGYPSHPLYKQIACMLQKWMDTKHCPILDLPSYDLLDEKVYVESRSAAISTITPDLEGLRTLHSLWVPEEIKYRLRDILVRLGKRGILDLLGVRKTVGTVDLWPPPRKLLAESFIQPFSSKAEISVGARALAKHHHRDQTDSWWGHCSGTEKQKNEHANSLLHSILDGATWINIHWLPQNVYVIEARVAEGYGMRWSADGKQFRGFLEPQMVDGHEVGWRH